ncbi:MAG: pantoate--beta-alanine ligase [Cytophagales bacterium]|nr:pantoate--beta-alanine ligase [Cytophagales bacterium]
MQVFKTIQEVRSWARRRQNASKSIGFVPTMGALHEGHLSLVRCAKQNNDGCIASIFVNPTQFNNAEDLKNYPRTLENDLRKLESAGCDAVFAPDAEQMYSRKPRLQINFGALEEVMEGAFRPGHFNGVALVVSKLFHIVSPARAYFGEKDFQQLAVIRCMTKDLSFDTEIVGVPTVREEDGLAMSSRNLRLTPAERGIAPAVYQSLQACRDHFLKFGQAKEAVAHARALLKRHPEITFEYLELVDAETLQPVAEPDDAAHVQACIAVHLGQVRLIDNISVK